MKIRTGWGMPSISIEEYFRRFLEDAPRQRTEYILQFKTDSPTELKRDYRPLRGKLAVSPRSLLPPPYQEPASRTVKSGEPSSEEASQEFGQSILEVLNSATKLRELLHGIDLYNAIYSLLIGSVDELGEAGQDQRYGFGCLNVIRAIDQAHKRGYA